MAGQDGKIEIWSRDIYDEQSGEAGLVTRLEAFLDTVSQATAQRSRRDLSAPFIPPPIPEKKVLGFPTMGRLGGALATVFQGENIESVGPLPVTRRTVELGEELAPEFMCYPLAVTIGQMRECLEAGANTIVMVGGKGRCRLGWYADLQESLLRKAGYNFKMLTINSPLPLQKNYRPFMREIHSILGRQPWDDVLRRALLAYRKAAAAEKAEEILYSLRAWEKSRGEGDRIFRGFEDSIRDAATFSTLKKVFREYQRECAAVTLTEGPPPYRVRLIGEIYAVFENFVNHEIARTLGSLRDIRIQVETEITVLNWFRYNILHTPSSLRRHRAVTRGAQPYLEDMVGGHGLDSVGLTVLAPKEGVDGVIHLWPFTCMPEIIAQSILTRVAREQEIPLLTVIINEQTGEAGLQTRIESFAHILKERRESSLFATT